MIRRLANTFLSSLFVLGCINFVLAQEYTVNGVVTEANIPIPFAVVSLFSNEDTINSISNEMGEFEFTNVTSGLYTFQVKAVGFEMYSSQLNVNSNTRMLKNIELKSTWYNLNQVVVTGTKTAKRNTESAVIVSVIDSKGLENTQSCVLSEGLKFQPGLRVETDCQTCNYTQLRMNGLGGGYSQILINGRPIFSPLTGLYGMDQIPANMIERIEIVRGGGSALYGSSAIGGIVNVITRVPTKNAFEAGYTYQNISGTDDYSFTGNTTLINKKKNAGFSLFLLHRERGYFDQNNDNFSELPIIENKAIGGNLFFKPKSNQKIEVNFSTLKEYRFGGEMLNISPHLTQQSEERTHNVLIGNVDYQINFNDDNSSIITYAAGQQTLRDHYTGIYPDDSLEIANHLNHPPYGTSVNQTYQGGIQVNHRIKNFLNGTNVFTLGAEFINDDIYDEIPSYAYLVNQQTQDVAAFIQSDWDIIPSLTLLSGVRIDKHNLVNHTILSPRFSLMYKWRKSTQIRASWSTGFRAPQAFDADLHIAFAGGGVSRITLDPNLKEERSNTLNASVNYDNAQEHFIIGGTAEVFYTQLNNAFFLQHIGADEFGMQFQKQNGIGATVQGVTLEARANFDRVVQLEAGYTLQSSLYDTPVEYHEGLEAKKEFLRTPANYGYATLAVYAPKKLTTSINLVQTGSMLIGHFGGSPEHTEDSYVTTPSFSEIGFKCAYSFSFSSKIGLELFSGIKNLTNAYQSDFDSGKNRDSNYIYGPAAPRTYFLGLKLKSI